MAEKVIHSLGCTLTDAQTTVTRVQNKIVFCIKIENVSIVFFRFYVQSKRMVFRIYHRRVSIKTKKTTSDVWCTGMKRRVVVEKNGEHNVRER